MRVVIAGGHGQIALRLERLLAARGDEGVVLDLENSDVDAVAEVLKGADAAVFSAGAGPGSGTARKDTVDRGAAALFAEAAERAGVRRHVQVGSIGADNPDNPGVSEEFRHYLRAKRAAEDDLKARDLDWTILRPGQLTNDPGTGLVLLAENTGRGPIPRDDVAAVLAGLLEAPASVRRTLTLISGETAIDEAISAL
jgi:uncharacterized protein YbjT (DUF2867 family)